MRAKYPQENHSLFQILYTFSIKLVEKVPQEWEKVYPLEDIEY